MPRDWVNELAKRINSDADAKRVAAEAEAAKTRERTAIIDRLWGTIRADVEKLVAEVNTALPDLMMLEIVKEPGSNQARNLVIRWRVGKVTGMSFTRSLDDTSIDVSMGYLDGTPQRRENKQCAVVIDDGVATLRHEEHDVDDVVTEFVRPWLESVVAEAGYGPTP